MLTAASTYTGNTTVLSGLLQLGNGGASGWLSTSSSLLLTGGTLGFDNTAGLVQGTNFSGGVISGSGSLLVSAGQVTLNQPNTFTGNIVINGGTLNANYANPGNHNGPSALGNLASGTAPSRSTAAAFFCTARPTLRAAEPRWMARL